MLFGGKPAREITEDDIFGIVREHVQERQHLEFKLTYDIKDSASRIEILKDIVSFANGSGGYIIIGIRDDGAGQAQKFESLDPKQAENLRKSISALCTEHIEERIEGLELEVRTVSGNTVIIMRVPASARAPHMVIFQNNTHFCKRYSDGKREMTLTEIRGAFNSDFTNQRLAAIEHMIRASQAPQVVEIRDRSDLLRLTDGETLAHHARIEFEKIIEGTPFFYIAATPVHPSQFDIDVSSSTVKALVNSPPGSRQGGWSMQNLLLNQRKQRGREVSWGSPEHNLLTLLPNGHLEFRTHLDDSFCWKQSDSEFLKRPRLYPYAVIEYPISFLKLYKALSDSCGITDDAFLLTLEFHYVKGYVLAPYSPNSPFFDVPSQYSEPYSEPNLLIKRRLSSPIDPESAGYALIKDVYASFGLGEQTIPFFDEETRTFRF